MSNYSLSIDEGVLSRLAAPPATPSRGDKYLVITTASGAWAGKEAQVAKWNGSAWDFYIASGADRVFVSAESKYYSYINGAWTPPSSALYEGGIIASTVHAQGQRPLTSRINQVSVVANDSDCVTLPPAVPGLECIVVADVGGAQQLKVYPAAGDECGGMDVNGAILPDLPISLHDECLIVHMYCYKAGHWGNVNTFYKGAIFNSTVEFANLAEFGNLTIAVAAILGAGAILNASASSGTQALMKLRATTDVPVGAAAAKYFKVTDENGTPFYIAGKAAT